ncbi:MAG: hypothetical protein KAU41_03100, partial [Deltaproteobacteria bacterium]|nr:hypothetical protein [Deltaproteobacteria bacterium]
KVLTEGKGIIARWCLKETEVQSYEPSPPHRLTKSGRCQDQLSPDSEEDTTKQREADRGGEKPPLTRLAVRMS